MSGNSIFFYLFAILSIVGALGVVTLPNLFHSALALVLVLLAGAALFVMLSAELIAVAQVLIYAGAIVVLMVFAIMLTKKMSHPVLRTHNEQMGLSAMVSVALGGTLGFLLVHFPWSISTAPDTTDSIRGIGEQLLSNYLLPFELVSVVLLIALIGGIILARDN